MSKPERRTAPPVQEESAGRFRGVERVVTSTVARRDGRREHVTAPVLCAHCQAPVRGRSPADPQPLCRRELSVAWSGPECALLVTDWGHPTPCVDCAGLAGPELGWPGLVWLAALCGVSVERVTEAVAWT